MKEIKKEEQVIKVTTMYQAFDGTEFLHQEECEKYENSAAGVLITRLQPYIINRNIDFQDFDGNDENEYHVLGPTDSNAIDIMNQLWYLYNGRGEQGIPYFTDANINQMFLFGYRFSEGALDWVWFYNMNDIIKDWSSSKFTITKVE